jgi:superfamily II DNA or RNA helicase
MKKTWRSFEEARTFVHTLGFKHNRQWYDYSKSGQRLADIPAQPYKIYTVEWKDWYDWLGVQRWLPFEEARAFVRGLGLTGRAQWRPYCQSGNKPSTIPAEPAQIYAAEWQGMNDWLGIQYTQKKTWLPFEQARAHVRGLGLATYQQWKDYSKSGQRLTDIPASPARTYAAEWQGWHDWLGVQRWLPFEEARARVRGLGLTTQPQWQIYCSSGKRSADIPADPVRVYAAEWQGWDDWFGRTEKTLRQKWRHFLAARTFIRELGFTSKVQWRAYCKSGSKPNDIPSLPSVVYAAKWQGWHDWLGIQCWRPFEEARAYARGIGFTSKVQWEVHAQSGEMPLDIPPFPETVYDEFTEYRDWLGIRKPGSGWRPFEEARLYVQALGLTTFSQWKDYSKSGQRPADIPADPACAYASEWQSWHDWLGIQRWRSFEEARAFVHELGLSTLPQWHAYCKSGEKPTDIPAAPDSVYKSKFRGYQDWLGCIRVRNKKHLLALLQDIRAHLVSLQEHELYEILDQSGVLPGFCALFPTKSVQHVLRDLLENNGKSLEERLTGAVSKANLQPHEVDDKDLTPSLWHVHTPSEITEERLRVLDNLPAFSNRLNDEFLEYLISNRVSALWEYAMNEGDAAVDALLRKSDGSAYFEEIKRRYLVERAAVDMLPLPSGWAFTDDQGNLCAPNLMQRRVAWMLRERRRVGNWSLPGTGKTLSAILASHVIDARITLIIAAHATIDQWEEQIHKAYPDSIVHRDIDEFLEATQDQHHYILLHYEKFQRETRGAFVASLATIQPNFIVFDEIQFIKQSDKEISHRREALEVLMEVSPSCAVLGMSATPVINNLLEAKKLLEIIIGVPLPEVGIRPTISNALMIHRLLMFYGIRYRPRYQQEIMVKVIRERRNDLLAKLLAGEKSLLGIEQTLLSARLESVRSYLRKGIMVYTHYIDGIVEPMQRYLEAMGLTVGIFTGNDKSGLESFKRGHIDILIGSSAVSIGVDGLQKVCNGIVIVSPPWTSTAYEQLIGRARRQGSFSPHVEVILPQIILEQEGETWSWDERRWDLIHYKRTLSDCAVDGHIPETIRINPQEFLERSYEALEQWIKRVGIVSNPLEELEEPNTNTRVLQELLRGWNRA